MSSLEQGKFSLAEERPKNQAFKKSKTMNHTIKEMDDQDASQI